MHITQITLKNFRCFEQVTLNFDQQIVVLQGLNGAGKTSLLEALHYACYLRSFRTYSPQELARLGEKSFFIKVGISAQPTEAHAHEIQVGFSGKRRMVKVDQKQVVSYKELLEYYRIITLTEDDLALIKEGPEIRRAFLDQVIMMYDPDFIHLSKKLRYTVDNRNALFKRGSISQDSYDFWTEQLHEVSGQVRMARKAALQELVVGVDALIAQFFPQEVSIECLYQSKKESAASYQAFMEQHPLLMHEEMSQGRSLFGAHLDDFLISFKQQKSRIFASRGQQKLIIMLLKVAQIQALMKRCSIKPIFLLDDFMTDFDEKRGSVLLDVLKMLDCQLIFTAPTQVGWFADRLSQLPVCRINITG